MDEIVAWMPLPESYKAESEKQIMSKWHTTEFCEGCAKEFCCTSECKYHLLHRVKQARDQIATQAYVWSKHNEDDTETVCMFKDAKASSYENCIEILNKLIAESEE